MTELEFALRIRQALNQGADSVSYKATLRLEKARQLAVARAREGAAVARPATVRLPALQLAAAGGGSFNAAAAGGGMWSWLRGAGLLAPVLTLAIGFVAIYQWHNQRFVEELADIDFAVLLDDAPIDAYADRGFGALLHRQAASVSSHDLAAGSEALTADAAVGDAAAQAPAEATDAPAGTSAQ